MKRTLPDPRDDDDRKVLGDIAEHGCHIVGVLAGEEGPAFAYSIGLFHNYGHPEILLFGLAHLSMQRMINGMRDEVRQGNHFIPGSRYADIIADFDCEFRVVDRSHYRDLFGYACWFYRGTDFPAVQCVWPDLQGCFPWQSEFDPKLTVLQPTHERSL